MPGKYCRGCGMRKRITWAEQFCTQRCAAEQYLLECKGDSEVGWCVNCGDHPALCEHRVGRLLPNG